MATAKNTRFDEYCDTLYYELTEMKARLRGLVREIEQMGATDRTMLETHVRHLQEISSMIDWKLEILGRVCPYNWAGFSGEVEKTVSVKVEDVPEQEVISGGYIGG